MIDARRHIQAVAASRKFLPMSRQLLADRPRGHLAAAPRLDAKRQPQRSISLPVFDVTEPADRFFGKTELGSGLSQREAESLAVIDKSHGLCSLQVNMASSRDFHSALTDSPRPFSHDMNMAAPDRPLWYLQEWFATQGRIQRDLITKLDWLPAKANKVWHGVQIAKLDEVAEIADLLNIAPWELLMAPDEAMKLRRLKSVIAEVAQPAPTQDAVATSRTGTNG